MDLHLAVSRSAPLRPQLERALRDAIRSGRLVDGTRLPPSRSLAADLGVSRGVVVEAYAQLVAEGYLVARQGQGTRVAPARAGTRTSHTSRTARGPALRHDLRVGIPDLAAFPRRQWASATARGLREIGDSELGYDAHLGVPGLRSSLAAYLGRVRAVACEPEQVRMTCGCSHGMVALWQALRRRGARRIAVEDPCWHLIATTIEHAGLEVVPIAVDEDGLCVDALEDAAVSAVAVSPAHQFPTGALLAPERRRRLIDWARRHDAVIVEDDYDAEFRYDREPVGSLQGLAPDRVAYLGSVSKTIAPGLSMGWMVAPPQLGPELDTVMLAGRAFPSVLVQAAYAVLLEEGDVDRHLRRMRRVYRERRDTLVAQLRARIPGCQPAGAAAGLHLMVSLDDRLDEAQLPAACARHDVAVDTLHDCARSTRPHPPALVLGYGRIKTVMLPVAVGAIDDAITEVGRAR